MCIIEVRIIKVLFIDLLSPDGHTDINRFFIKTMHDIENIDSIDLVGKEKYFDNNDFILPRRFFIFNNKFDFRLKNILKIKWIFNNIEVEKYDIIFISSYETISFSIAWRKKMDARILIFNHNNIDALKNSKIKKFFFKLINNQVEHIVYEDFIKKYIKTLHVGNKVWVNHHPIDLEKNENRVNSKSKSDNKLLIYAPSSSNDDIFIRKLINYNNRKKVLNDKIRLIIKSNNINFEDEQLKVINDRVSYENYISNFKKSDFISLLFEDDFEYRVSGVFFDALAFKKRLLFKENKFSRYYINKYPELGYCYTDVKSFISTINDLTKKENKKINDKKNIFDKIYEDYSRNKISNELSIILNGGSSIN